MDTSETYVKMCDCSEIQGEWKSQNGDWYLSDGDTVKKGLLPDELEIRHVFLGSPTYLHKWRHDKLGTAHSISRPKDKKHTWLPRQDQIQEMMWGEFKEIPQAGLKILFEDIHYSHDEKMAKYYHQFTSFEQLWLAFYMHEKYGKIWNGEKWTKK